MSQASRGRSPLFSIRAFPSFPSCRFTDVVNVCHQSISNKSAHLLRDGSPSCSRSRLTPTPRFQLHARSGTTAQ
jgi:hypothetical protein